MFRPSSALHVFFSFLYNLKSFLNYLLAVVAAEVVKHDGYIAVSKIVNVASVVCCTSIVARSVAMVSNFFCLIRSKPLRRYNAFSV